MNTVEYGIALVTNRTLQIGHGAATLVQLAIVIALVIALDVSLVDFAAGLCVSMVLGGLLGFAVSFTMAAIGKIGAYLEHSYAISLMLGLVAALIGYSSFIGFDATLMVVGVPWAAGTLMVLGLQHYAEKALHQDFQV